eukprot:TRINITY_DN28111_c0_g1_i1.p1 TRINITY_DN28111_c0_g1~~TRINITY_DN28111_c0_g1_i1.p1  ORF type:complete len:495 (+),score=117.07 TRINITY_DN28111_c0_g1_i1:60-1487(+)
MVRAAALIFAAACIKACLSCTDDAGCYELCRAAGIAEGDADSCIDITCSSSFQRCACSGSSALRSSMQCEGPPIAVAPSCAPKHDVLFNVATYTSPELSSRDLATGSASRALRDVVLPRIAAHALEQSAGETVISDVQLITDAPGLAGSGQLRTASGPALVHFDLAFSLCTAGRGAQQAESDKRAFELKFAKAAAEDYEAFKISTLRLLSFEAKASEKETTQSSSPAPGDSEARLGASEVETPFLEKMWWLPWTGAGVLLLVTMMAWIVFKMRRRARKEAVPEDFIGALPTRPERSEGPDGWTWQSQFFARALYAFDPEESEGLGQSGLRLSVGDLVQVEAVVDELWCYGHTACEPELVGLFPRDRVERLGIRGPAPGGHLPPASARLQMPSQGLVMRVSQSFLPGQFVNESSPVAAADTELLEVTAGAEVEVLAATANGWLFGRHLKAPLQSGYFPESCMALQAEEAGAALSLP